MPYHHRPLKQLHRHHRIVNRQRQQGVVIIVALFIVALVATMSYYLMERLARDTRRTMLITRQIQAEDYAQGAIYWAIDSLSNNIKQQTSERRVDYLPIHSPRDHINGYTIQSHIWDMEARFNLNNLTDTNWQTAFMHFLKVLVPQMSDEACRLITFNIVQWITPGAKQSALAQYYLQLPIPYRMAHQLMADKSELRLVRGITPPLYQALSPYIIALPVTTPINVTTATPPVLTALSPRMTLSMAQSVAKMQGAITTKDSFLNLPPIKDLDIKSEHISIVSHFFLLETTVSIEKQQVVLYTLLERVTSGHKAAVNVLWQSKGSW